MEGISRRCQLDKFYKEEMIIWKAMQAVEEMPADPLLTDAVNFLMQAKDKVSDYYDKKLEH